VPPLAALALAGAAAAGAEDAPKYRRTVVRYEPPDVTLVNQDGARVKLSQVLSADKPVLLKFFFTTCTTICPVLSAGSSNMIKTLGEEARDVHVVSIAIDPDHDTPEVLQDYRKRFGAGPEWELLTGSKGDIERVRRAFDAYSVDKMAHRPLNFLRPAGGTSWVRIDGLIGSADLMAEYRGLRRP
jgi:protein SCO1/2